VALVRYGDQIVGMRAVFGTRWTTGSDGDEVTIPHADDLVIHPDHRGRGLFVPLNDFLLEIARGEGYRHIVSLSGGLLTQQLSLVDGWMEVGDLERLHRPALSKRRARQSRVYRTVRPFLARIVRRMLAPRSTEGSRLPTEEAIESVVERIARDASPNITIASTADLTPLTEVREPIDPVRTRHVRSEQFYRWRLSNPDRRYRIVSYRDPHRRGFLVLSWTSRTPYSIKIAEMRARDIRVAEELLRSVTGIQRANLELMSSTQPGLISDCATGLGFSPFPDPENPQARRRFLLVPTDPANNSSPVGAADPSVLSSWHVSLIDTMGS
jgi:hypothetical protein